MISNQQNLIKKLYDINNYLRARTDHYCPVVSSKAIKKALINRCTELGVSPMEVCVRSDVSWASFDKNYLKSDNPNSRPSIRHEDLVKFGNKIGIDIRINLIMTPVENVSREKLLMEYIPHGTRKKNKKLS